MPEPLLEIRNVTKTYGTGDSAVAALQDFSLTIYKDRPQIVSVAGESGSGKSTLAGLLLGFVRPTAGSVVFDGLDLSRATPRQMRDYRRQVQAVFQDPFGSFNPFYRIGHVFDAVIRNFGLAKSAAHARDMVEEGLNAVGLSGSEVLRRYPHQLSGGQRQRIMLARAYLVRPRVIVADEPVSMVDASLRASILEVMMRLRDESGISFLYVTHDLSTVYQIGDRILVFYQGTLVETGDAVDVISRPMHPYVRLLVESVPRPDPAQRWKGEITLPPEEELRNARVPGCRFVPRCPHARARCSEAMPQLVEVGPGRHRAACVLYEPGAT